MFVVKLFIVIPIPVIKDPKIVLVSEGGYMAIVHCRKDSTSRLCGMGAVVVTATVHQCTHFGEPFGNLILIEIGQSKFLDPRGVNDITPTGERQHFGERGGMLPFQVVGGYF
jgi:hypothetical protein